MQLVIDTDLTRFVHREIHFKL